MGDIARINLLVLEFREKNLPDDTVFATLMDHFSRYKSFGMWPNKLAFEEYKWRAEYFLLSHEALLMLSRERDRDRKSDLSKKLKFYSLLLFQNYVKNVQYQIDGFQSDKDHVYDEDVSGSKATPRYIRYLGYYGCVNQGYPTDGNKRDANKESLEKRIEYERFSNIKSRVKREIEEAIELAAKSPTLVNVCTSLKVIRNNFETNFVAKIKTAELSQLWYWEDIFNSSLSSSRPRPGESEKPGRRNMGQQDSQLRELSPVSEECHERPAVCRLGEIQASLSTG